MGNFLGISVSKDYSILGATYSGSPSIGKLLLGFEIGGLGLVGWGVGFGAEGFGVKVYG